MARAKRNTTVEIGGLTVRQERVAVCLARGETKARASRECRVGYTTIETWSRDPTFNARVKELREQLTDRAVGRLAEMMAGTALDALLARLTKKDKKTGELVVGLDDIKATFELFGNMKNAGNIAERLAELEEAIADARRAGK